jgi:Protein of unknown function (DUF726)
MQEEKAEEEVDLPDAYLEYVSEVLTTKEIYERWPADEFDDGWQVGICEQRHIDAMCAAVPRLVETQRQCDNVTPAHFWQVYFILSSQFWERLRKQERLAQIQKPVIVESEIASSSTSSSSSSSWWNPFSRQEKQVQVPNSDELLFCSPADAELRRSDDDDDDEDGEGEEETLDADDFFAFEAHVDPFESKVDEQGFVLMDHAPSKEASSSDELGATAKLLEELGPAGRFTASRLLLCLSFFWPNESRDDVLCQLYKELRVDYPQAGTDRRTAERAVWKLFGMFYFRSKELSSIFTVQHVSPEPRVIAAKLPAAAAATSGEASSSSVAAPTSALEKVADTQVAVTGESEPPSSSSSSSAAAAQPIAMVLTARERTLKRRGQRLHGKLMRLARQLRAAPLQARKALLCTCLAASMMIDRYDARYRVSWRYMASLIDLRWRRILRLETATALQVINLRRGQPTESMGDDIETRTQSSGRWWKVGAATAIGFTALAITGGLAAPVVIPALGSIVAATAGAASAAGLGAVGAGVAAGGAVIHAGGAVALGSVFGAIGGSIAGKSMNARTVGLKQFEFVALAQATGVPVYIAVPGFLLSDRLEAIKTPFQPLVALTGRIGEHYVVRWETELLLALGSAFSRFVQTALAKEVASMFLKKIALVATVLSVIAWPMTMATVCSLVDNPWALALSRAERAGALLADIVFQHQSFHHRPVNLIGCSIGALVIVHCLRSLHERYGARAHGLVENVILMGTPESSDPLIFEPLRAMASGRFINVYSRFDWVLSFLFRASSFTASVAGLVPIQCASIENVDVSNLISGHLDYPVLMPALLRYASMKSSGQVQVEKEQLPEKVES